MVTDDLRRVMLAAEGAGRLTGDGVATGVADHPVCGDAVELDCRLRDGRIVELAWRAHGCPATMAVIAAAPSALQGVLVADAESRIRDRLRELGGLAATESHALAMVLRAVQQVQRS